MGLTCKNLGKTFESRQGPVTALDNVSFSVAPGEFLCLVGPSGCGKTTLLKLIAGLLQPSSGSVRFNGREGTHHLRSAMVFQDHGLFPWMTVLDNVAFALESNGTRRKERCARAAEFIRKLGLARFAESFPHELSGGMQQRVAIARAFLADPEILLMDEPFGALDAQTRLVLQQELLRIWRDDQKMVVYITHDIEEAVLLGDRVLVMTGRPGHILEEIAVPLGRPRHPTAAEHPEVMELRRHIWNRLEAEVRTGMQIIG